MKSCLNYSVCEQLHQVVAAPGRLPPLRRHARFRIALLHNRYRKASDPRQIVAQNSMPSLTQILAPCYGNTPRPRPSVTPKIVTVPFPNVREDTLRTPSRFFQDYWYVLEAVEMPRSRSRAATGGRLPAVSTRRSPVIRRRTRTPAHRNDTAEGRRMGRAVFTNNSTGFGIKAGKIACRSRSWRMSPLGVYWGPL